MIKNNQEIFFEHIKKIFLQNPHLDINLDTIYGELMLFNVENNNISRIEQSSLVDTQVNMFAKYKRNKEAHTFISKNGYFWVIENRGILHQKKFYDNITNSIKLYIAVDSSNINMVASKIFDYIISEGIISQSKISKDFRNDALVVRIGAKDDAEKVIEFVNNLDYTSKVMPNPFTYNVGKVNVAIDGSLSYNSTFCKLLVKYLKERNDLNDANLKDFGEWLQTQIDILTISSDRNVFFQYGINSDRELKDYIMVAKVLSKNLDGTISKDYIYEKQSERVKHKEQETIIPSDNEVNYMLYIVNGLAEKYGIDEAHARIMEYVKNISDIRIFTRDKNIRKIVNDNFTPNRMRDVLKEIGYGALVNATEETIVKYDIEQAKYAILEFVEQRNIDAFTNDKESRSYLGLVVPTELLCEAIVDKTNEQGINPSKKNIVNMIIEEADKLNKNKGRK